MLSAGGSGQSTPIVSRGGDAHELVVKGKIIAEQGLEGVVAAPGFVDEDVLESALGRALCLVLPSRREGYGLVVLEALSLGVSQPVRRQRDADENADHQRDEDSSKRGDVVAEIEHRRLEPRASLAQRM